MHKTERCKYDGDRCVRCGANWFDQALRGDDEKPCHRARPNRTGG